MNQAPSFPAYLSSAGFAITRRTVFALTFFLPALPAFSADVIPENLVGVWATDKAVLRGALLFEGGAVYLGIDGIGAIVGGPPPIGSRIVFTYDPKTNVIAYQATENGKTVHAGTFTYDPTRQVLSGDKEVLRRRFDKLTDETRRALGLEPTVKTNAGKK